MRWVIVLLGVSGCHGVRPSPRVVVGWIDLPFLRESLDLDEPEAVLNGIAYEPSTRRLIVTGKLWPAMFEVALSPAP